MTVSGKPSDLVRRRRVLSFLGLAKPHPALSQSIWIATTDTVGARCLRPSGRARLMHGFPASEGPKPALFIAAGPGPAVSGALPYVGARERLDHPASHK